MDVDQAVENEFASPNTQVSLSRAMKIADAEGPTLFDFIKRSKKGEHPHLGMITTFKSLFYTNLLFFFIF
jgi:hypothetical protein